MSRYPLEAPVNPFIMASPVLGRLVGLAVGLPDTGAGPVELVGALAGREATRAPPVTGSRYQNSGGSLRHSPTGTALYPSCLSFASMNGAKSWTVALRISWLRTSSGARVGLPLLRAVVKICFESV